MTDLPERLAEKAEEFVAPLRELGELTTALLTAATVDDVLQRIVVAARLLIPAADLVSITVRRGEGDYYTPIKTDPEAIELDRLQYASDRGPCMDAAHPDGPAYAHSGDLTGETPWPEFAAGAAEHGYRSILATALLNRPEPSSFTGALNIYSRKQDSLGVVARDTGFLLATYASLSLDAAMAVATAEQALTEVQAEAANLRKALDTRTVIGQATGILMARRGLGADDAFKTLTRASQDHNIKLARLAELLADHPATADRI